MKTDTELQQDVMNGLKWEPTLKAAEIGVAVKDGVVMLSGRVGPYGMAITKQTARTCGVNPVRYLDITPGRDWLTSPLLPLAI